MICIKCKAKTPITYDDLCEECEFEERKNPKEREETPKDRWARLHAHLFRRP